MNIKKANKQLKKVMRFLQENEKVFSMMDLKLHDVSYYCFTDFTKDFPTLYKESQEMYYDDIFSSFCNYEYDCMIEYFGENDIAYNPEYIGRTSKFYLSKYVSISCRCPYSIDFQQSIYDLLYENGYTCDCMPDITENGLIDITDKYINDCYTNIDYIASGDFFKDVKKQLSDCIKAYEYIADFKNNQVEYFKDFCNNEMQCRLDNDITDGLTAAELILDNLDFYGVAI